MSSLAQAPSFAGSWSKLNPQLTPWIQDVISSQGFSQMTPVQASAIPLFMKHKDVVVEVCTIKHPLSWLKPAKAVTGSGKTLAFVVPIIEKLIRRGTPLRKNEVGALLNGIVTSSELAAQIHSIFQLFLEAQPPPQPENVHPDDPAPAPTYPPSLLLVSGTDSTPAQDTQRFSDTSADIVIGTPGRIEEFLLGRGSNRVSVKELEVLVLDEADRLLDLGFLGSITKILRHLPKQRRTGLFSATMTDALSELVRVGLRNPVRIVVKVENKKRKAGEAVMAERRTPATHKGLQGSLHTSQLVPALNILLNPLSQLSKTKVYTLHGHLTPTKRASTLAAFAAHPSTSDSPSLLLATDVAARGLDLPDVDVVIQYDPPTDPKQYSHRAGRTARAGRKGRAWALLCEGREQEYVGQWPSFFIDAQLVGIEICLLDFLAVRQIPLKEHPYIHASDESTSQVGAERPLDSDAPILFQSIRDIVRKDRDIYDKSMKAFVSFVRAYSKHEASYIFRIKDLDLVGVAKAFGLVRLPKMPELTSREGWTDLDIDWDTIPYLDKTREAQRQVALQTASETAEARQREREATREQRMSQKKKNSAWSNQVARSEARELRKEKKGRKREWLKRQQILVAETETQDKASDDSGDDDGEQDWEELKAEERASKKMKKSTKEQTETMASYDDL
ncbi:DEAD protein, partial [Rhizoctonia solani]